VVVVGVGKSAAASMVAAALLLLLLVCSFGRERAAGWRHGWAPSDLAGATGVQVVVDTGLDFDSGTTFGVVEMVPAWLVWLDEAIVKSNNLWRANHV
jgi:hypothetical protein